MMKLANFVACATLSAVTLTNVAFARDLDRSDPDRANILAAVHRLNNSDPDLKDYHYVVVDLLKDRDAAFLCVGLADKDGRLEMTDDQTEIMTFALEKRSTQWSATYLSGVGFAAAAKPVPADCQVDGHVVNTRTDINAALKAMGHKPFSPR